MQNYILSIDQGTTSSRAILFNLEGQPVATEQQSFTQHYPHNGWVEHDPQDIWQTVLDCSRQVMANQQIHPEQVIAIGITNQRETTLVWDRHTGEPVYRAIVWQDRRTAEKCARLQAEGHEAWVQQRTGLLLDAYFSASKLAWLLEHVPGVRARAGSDDDQMAPGQNRAQTMTCLVRAA